MVSPSSHQWSKKILLRGGCILYTGTYYILILHRWYFSSFPSLTFTPPESNHKALTTLQHDRVLHLFFNTPLQPFYYNINTTINNINSSPVWFLLPSSWPSSWACRSALAGLLLACSNCPELTLLRRGLPEQQYTHIHIKARQTKKRTKISLLYFTNILIFWWYDHSTTQNYYKNVWKTMWGRGGRWVMQIHWKRLKCTHQ